MIFQGRMLEIMQEIRDDRVKLEIKIEKIKEQLEDLQDLQNGK